MNKNKAKKLKKAFKEVYAKEPRIVGKTRAKKGNKAARKQKVAISLSKAGLSKKKKK